MNINDLLNGHHLPPLPMRAWLSNGEDTTPRFPSCGWVIEDCWTSRYEQPLLCRAKLRALRLEGSPCLAVVGNAVRPGEGEVTDEDEHALVYLLNPADPCVWDAIDCWHQNRFEFMWIRSGAASVLGTLLPEHDSELGDARDVKGEELESDLLAGELLGLMKRGLLEQTLAAQFDIQRPMSCAIVETPMMCKSLTPVDPELLAMHLAHRANKLLLEDIDG